MVTGTGTSGYGTGTSGTISPGMSMGADCTLTRGFSSTPLSLNLGKLTVAAVCSRQTGGCGARSSVHGGGVHGVGYPGYGGGAAWCVA